MAQMDHERPGRRHPLVDEAASKLRSGRMSRRGFLRLATLLGVGAGSASLLASRFDGGAPAIAADASTGDARPREGGILRCAMQVAKVDDPARHAWTEMSNLTRHQNEYLTVTGADNITRPMLAERWSASDDLKTWTFNLRPGVTWHNGDAFTAEDVAFNVERWLKPENGSPNLGLFSAMVETVETGEIDAQGRPVTETRPIDGAVEIVDPLTVRMHLSTPLLSMPENLYNYPTAIVHRGFSGDVVADRNGTGAYQILENTPGERSISRKARIDGWRYWGADIPHIGPGYVDEIQYVHFEPASQASVAAVLGDLIDMNHAVSPEWLEAAGLVPEASIRTADTAQTGCIRMRVDAPPFDDVRVRRAVQLCCDPSAFQTELFDGRGQLGEHHHVSPIHLDYFPLPKIDRDIEQARALLTEAGHPNGVDLQLTVGNTSGAWQQRACEMFKAQAAPAGIRIELNVVSPERYQELWLTAPFGLTHWTHRPLGTMALSLGYRSGVPWNETGFSDPEFDAALSHAEALIDVRERQAAMEDVQRRLQRAAIIVQPLWAPIFFLAKDRVKGLEAHPAQYHLFNNVWLDA